MNRKGAERHYPSVISGELETAFTDDNPLALRWIQQSHTQQVALKLWSIGLNPIPFAYGKKHPIEYIGKDGNPRRMRWSMFKTTRLHHDPENPMRKGGLLSVFAGLCNIAVVLTENLIVIDCETRGALVNCLEDLRQREIPRFVIYSGGRRSGGHVYLRIAEGAVNPIPHNPENPQVSIPEIEIRARGEVVLAEGSVHPDTGRVYEADALNVFAPPSISIYSLDWLYNARGERVMLSLAKGQGKPRKPTANRVIRLQRIADEHGLTGDARLWNVNNRTLDYLENGHLLQGTHTRNARLIRSALEFNGCRYSYNEARGSSVPSLRRADFLAPKSAPYYNPLIDPIVPHNRHVTL